MGTLVGTNAPAASAAEGVVVLGVLGAPERPKWRDRAAMLAADKAALKRAILSHVKWAIKRIAWRVEYLRRTECVHPEYRGDGRRINAETAGKLITVEQLLDYVLLNEFPRRYGIRKPFREVAAKAVRKLVLSGYGRTWR